MSLSVSALNFEGSVIRWVGDKPVANDVAQALGYADPAKTVSTKVFPEYRSVTKMVTVDGKRRNVTVLSEPGIYQLIFGSKLDSAKQFQSWVFQEVLPSLRKTGSYSVATPRDDLRLSSTEVRKATMDALHAAGFTESRHYINVTTAAYIGLFGMSAKSLRKDRGLPEGCNVRDHLTEEELAALRLIEINLKETLRVIEFTRSSDVNRHIKAVAASIRASLAAGAVRGQLPG